MGEEIDVSRRVDDSTVNEVGVPRRTEKVFDVIEFNVDDWGFLIGDLLELDHVFALAVNGVRFKFWVLEGSDEVSAACLLPIVVGDVELAIRKLDLHVVSAQLLIIKPAN